MPGKALAVAVSGRALAVGTWQLVDDGTVRCPHCGSEHVGVKSKKPRLKAYQDEHGHRQTIEVYRYYCKNSDCSYQTFTNLPPGLIAYSVWTLDARLKALELYTGPAHELSQCGQCFGRRAVHAVSLARPVRRRAAAGRGSVRVGAQFRRGRVDEKYVQVPKNTKPAGKQRKWMYVYVAVDMHTLDLLHINSSRTWAKTRPAPSCSNCAPKAITRASSSPT